MPDIGEQSFSPLFLVAMAVLHLVSRGPSIPHDFRLLLRTCWNSWLTRLLHDSSCLPSLSEELRDLHIQYNINCNDIYDYFQCLVICLYNIYRCGSLKHRSTNSRRFM